MCFLGGSDRNNKYYADELRSSEGSNYKEIFCCRVRNAQAAGLWVSERKFCRSAVSEKPAGILLFTDDCGDDLSPGSWMDLQRVRSHINGDRDHTHAHVSAPGTLIHMTTSFHNIPIGQLLVPRKKRKTIYQTVQLIKRDLYITAFKTILVNFHWAGFSRYVGSI